jgi:hypothetical protein
VQHSDQDDFELWSPSEEREELCLFGRQVRAGNFDIVAIIANIGLDIISSTSP